MGAGASAAATSSKRLSSLSRREIDARARADEISTDASSSWLFTSHAGSMLWRFLAAASAAA